MYGPIIIIHPSGAFGASTSLIGGVTGYAAWPVANLAIYCPIILPFPVVVTTMFLAVETAGDDADFGLYDCCGVRLFSTGSSALSASNVNNRDISPDYWVGPGGFYMATVVGGTTAQVLRSSSGLQGHILAGYLQEAVGSSTLPAKATFARMAQAFSPNISMKVQIALV